METEDKNNDSIVKEFQKAETQLIDADDGPDQGEKPSCTLLVANLRRPFTTPELRETLEIHGSVTYQWVSRIKTHCFATFDSIENSNKAREDLHMKVWPQGGRRLVTKFVSDEDLQDLIKVDQLPGFIKPILNQVNEGQDVPLKKIKMKRVNGKQIKVRYSLKQDLEEKKVKKAHTSDIDSLFRKTVTKPHLYYLPLSEEQVNAKKAKILAIDNNNLPDPKKKDSAPKEVQGILACKSETKGDKPESVLVKRGVELKSTQASEKLLKTNNGGVPVPAPATSPNALNQINYKI